MKRFQGRVVGLRLRNGLSISGLVVEEDSEKIRLSNVVIGADRSDIQELRFSDEDVTNKERRVNST